jgi:hypothetical protein
MARPSGFNAIDRIVVDGNTAEERLMAAAILVLRDEVARLNEELARAQRHVELPVAVDREPAPAEAGR